MKIGEIYLSLGKHNQALEQFSITSELEPFTKEVWKKHIEQLYSLKRYEECIQYCEEIYWLIDCAPFYKSELAWLIPLCKEAQNNLKQIKDG